MAGIAIVERLDLRPDVAHREHLARDGVGAGDGGGIRPGIVLRAHRKYRSHAVDEAVGDGGGDDLAAQADGASGALAKRCCTGAGK